MIKKTLPLLCLVVLACTACRGRHADGTPSGETVEVDIATMQVAAEPADATTPDAEPASTATDSTEILSTADSTAVPALTGNPQ